MASILWRKLTFWDNEQIEEIKKREIDKFIKHNKEYQKLMSEISTYETEIERNERYIDDTREEVAELKKQILKDNPHLKDFNINIKWNY